MVDWSKPIEAVHQDGRVVPVGFARRRLDGSYATDQWPVGSNAWWKASGEDYCLDSSWRIRNVAQPASKLPGNSGELPSTRPSDEVVAVKRMTIDDAREMLKYDTETVLQTLQDWGYVELPESVDADLVEAREIVASAYSDCGYDAYAIRIRNGEHDANDTVQKALAALRRGKQMAGEG